MCCRAGVMRRRCAHVHDPSGGKASSDRENGHTAHMCCGYAVWRRVLGMLMHWARAGAKQSFCSHRGVGTKFYLLALGVSSRGERQTDHPLIMSSVAQMASISTPMRSESSRKPSSALPHDLCDSGIIDSPSVSGGVPRGCLWRFTWLTTELSGGRAIDFRDL
jgi:hypothetical protein